MISFVRLTLASAISLAPSYAAATAPMPFATQPLVAGPSHGSHYAMAPRTPSACAPVVCYCAPGPLGSTLRFGTRVGSTWQFIDLASIPSCTGAGPSVWTEFREGACVHFVSYYEGISGVGSLVVMTDETGAWVRRVVDATGQAGQFSSIRVAPNGDIGVSYYDEEEGDLKFATRSGLTWSTEFVHSGGNVGNSSSLAFDASGRPHIAHMEVPSGTIYYAVRDDGSWDLEPIVAAHDFFVRFAMAVDAAGTPFVSYQDAAGEGHLSVASRVSGSWSSTLVDALPATGMHSSMSPVDPSRIFYYDFRRGDLRYAERAGGAWVTQIVDEGGDVGGWPAIGTDASGRPIVASVDFTGGGLRFAAATGTPTAVRVDPAPAPPRMRVAPNPFVHATEIHRASGGKGRATLDLFNVRGERVARLWEGDLAGAPIRVRWDGSTRSGQAPAGIYWARLRAAGVDERRTLIRVR